MTFGDFFKAKRIELKLTLRKFADRYEEDPAYISRLERGLAAAPKAKEKLKFYAEALGLAEGSPDWDQFFELAAVSNKTYGIDEVQNEKLLEKLPVFLRTIDNKDLDEEKLNDLIDLIRKS